MAIPFSRSLRSLESGQSGVLGGFGAALAALFVVWCTWFLGARVPVVASTDSARVEVSQTGHRVQAQVSGYVTFVHQELEGIVSAGDTLVELDATAEERERDRQVADREAVENQLEAIRREARALERVIAAQHDIAGVELEEGRVRQSKAEDLARFFHDEEQRKVALGGEGLLSWSAVWQAQSDARQQRTEAITESIVTRRVRAARDVAESEEFEKLAGLARDEAALEGRRRTLDATLEEAQHGIDERHIRAPVSGRLGDVAAITAGTFVHEGDVVGTVIPGGDLRVVAYFPPADAIGRIRPGQRARVRFAAFPWTEYGTTTGSVSRIADEVHEGLVRVELRLASTGSPIPIEHGMPGAVEVDVDEVSPAALVFRAVGRRLNPRLVNR